jgi:hypothetical protein
MYYCVRWKINCFMFYVFIYARPFKTYLSIPNTFLDEKLFDFI